MSHLSPYETVEHHLFDCTQLMGPRSDFLPDQRSIGNTLYCDSEQLRATCKLYHQASCLGAAAQRQSWIIIIIHKCTQDSVSTNESLTTNGVSKHIKA